MSSQLSAKLNLDVSGFEQSLNGAKNSVEEYKTSLGDLSHRFTNVRKELSNSKKLVNTLEFAWRSMTDAEKESAQGQVLFKNLQEAKKYASDLVDTVGDVQQELKNMASDTAALDAFKDGFAVLGNTVSAAANAYASLTGDSKSAKQALTAFAAVQSTVNALTAISNALQKQSSLMLGLRKLAQIGVNIQTAAAKAQQEGYNVALAIGKALMADWKSLLMMAAVALGGYAFIANMVTDQQEEMNGETDDAIKKFKEYQKELKDVYVQTAGKLMASFIKLRTEWNSLNSEAEKTKFIKEYANELKNLGVQVNNITDAQRLFSDQNKDFIKAIVLQAQSAVLAKRIQDEANKAMEAGEGSWKYEMFLNKAEELAQELVKTNAEVDSILGKFNRGGKSVRTSSTVKEIKYVTGSLAELEAKLTKLQNDQKNGLINLSAEEYIKQVNDLQNQIKSKKEMLGIEVPVLVDESEFFDKYKEINDKFNTAPNAKFDFSGLSEEMHIEADIITNEIDRITEHIKELQELLSKTQDPALISSIKGEIDGLNIELENSKNIQSALNEESQKRLALADYIDKESQAWGYYGDMLNNVSGAFKVLGDSEGAQAAQMTLNTASILANAVSTIAAMNAEAIAKGASSAFALPFPANLAAWATIISTISSIFSSLPKFADGGIVTGPYGSGDRMIARVNDGEMIFNRRQQRNLFNAIDHNRIGNASGTVQVIGTTLVRGTDLDIVWSNYNKTKNRAR